MENFDVLAVIERMKSTLNVKTDKALAAFFDVSPSAVGNWKLRNLLPMNISELFAFCNSHNITFDWLIFGQERTQPLDVAQRMILTAFDALDDQKKLEAITFISGLNTKSSGIQIGDNNSGVVVHNSKNVNVEN